MFHDVMMNITTEEDFLTVLPYMENLVEAAIFDSPVANQLRVGGAQVDLLIGQFEEGCVLFWSDTVGPKLIESSVFLLGTRGEMNMRLQREDSGQNQNQDHRQTTDCDHSRTTTEPPPLGV